MLAMDDIEIGWNEDTSEWFGSSDIKTKVGKKVAKKSEEEKAVELLNMIFKDDYSKETVEEFEILEEKSVIEEHIITTLQEIGEIPVGRDPIEVKDFRTAREKFLSYKAIHKNS